MVVAEEDAKNEIAFEIGEVALILTAILLLIDF